MKIRCRPGRWPGGVVLILLACTVRAAVAPPPPEFTGVLIFPTKTLISLKDQATGTSKWVAPGQSFAGSTLVSYEAKDETVVVAVNGEAVRLPLKEAKIQNSQILDLRRASLSEKQFVWAKIKDLQGQDLMEALIANGSREMLGAVEALRDRILRIDASRAKLATALLRTDLSEEKTADLKKADAMLLVHLAEIQPQLERTAVILKGIIQRSITP